MQQPNARPRVPAEGAAEHLRNALQLLDTVFETAEIGWPGVIVPVQTLVRLQCRLEAALDQLDPQFRVGRRFTWRPGDVEPISPEGGGE